jgi:lipopolysaccharide/colanic/teichoic acid biosynthesis glycosyltransferase
MLTRKQRIKKYLFDLSVSFLLLLISVIPLLVLWLITSLDTGRNGLFIQERIGRLGKPFKLYKFRTLKGDEHQDIKDIDGDKTRFGNWLRSTKLDELPQLFNVLKGDMSLVGPRPDIPGYADQLQGDDRVILSVKPGITGPATIKYRDEDQLLLSQVDPMKYNDEVIWPDKVAINKEYVMNWSFWKDVGYLYISII